MIFFTLYFYLFQLLLSFETDPIKLAVVSYYESDSNSDSSSISQHKEGDDSDNKDDGGGDKKEYDFNQCKVDNSVTYKFCASKKTCLMCSLTVYCGWCHETKTCVPRNTGTDKTQAICPESCNQKLTDIEECANLFIQKFGEDLDADNNLKVPQFMPTWFERQYHPGMDFYNYLGPY